jgi:peptidoglycan hydrolase-like protein with peptidoglycan-binding domain
VYVVSPVTGDDSGVITPPDGGFGNDPNAVYEQLLDILANPSQDPNDPNFDKTAGVYLDTKDFDPTHPGKQLSGQDAWTALSSGKPLYFHPPNGDWETIQSVDDLNAYLYTQEQQQTPDDPSGPPQSNGLLLLDPTRAPLQVGDGMGTNEPNDDVRTLQQRLSVCGFNVGQPDGQFGPGTERAVRSFQSAHRLPVTGLADAATLDAVNQVSNIDMEAGQVINDAQTLVSDDLNTRPVSKRTPEQKARLRQEALTDVADSRQFLGDYDKTTDNLRRDGVAKAAFPIARNGVAAADANQPHK